MSSHTDPGIIKRLGLLVPSTWNPKEVENINGPCVIQWNLPPIIPFRKKLYLMYFADHWGTYIRVAWSLKPSGSFTRIPFLRPLLIRAHFDDRVNHVASPEVVRQGQKTYLFTHSPIKRLDGKQVTFLSRLRLGVFCSKPKQTDLPSYARFFNHVGRLYAITFRADIFEFDIQTLASTRIEVDKKPLLTSDAPVEAVRHPHVVKYLDQLLVFYTRTGDAPERIFVSRMEFKSQTNVGFGEPIEVIRPEMNYEGALLPIAPSKKGKSQNPEQSLRDPFVAVFDKDCFLYYAVSGERGIACLKIDLKKIVKLLEVQDS